MTVRTLAMPKTRIRPKRSSAGKRRCRKAVIGQEPADRREERIPDATLEVVAVVLSATICHLAAGGSDRKRRPANGVGIATVAFSALLIAWLLFGHNRKRGHMLFASLSFLVIGSGWLARHFF